MDQATGDARNKQLVVNQELDDRVKFLAARRQHAVKLLSLRNSTGETVEDKARMTEVSTSQ